MKIRNLFLVIPILLLTGSSLALSQAYQEWVASYGGPSTSEEGVDLAVDPDGFVYVTGDQGSHIATVKYDTDGNQVWSVQYTAGYSGNATCMALDGGNNVLVTGYIDVSPGEVNWNYATVKYNSAGVQQWTATYNGPSNAWCDQAWDMAVDHNDNAYVTGFTAADGNWPHYLTVKYNSAGALQWAATYDGPANSENWAKAIAVDDEGNAYVTGHSSIPSVGSDYVTIKYNTDGQEQWVARYDDPGSGGDVAAALALDADGNVYVTGSSWTEESSGFTTIKYDNNGNPLWTAYLVDSIAWGGELSAMTLDPQGNVIITGESGYPEVGQADYITLKYSPEGQLLWQAYYDGPGHFNDVATDVATDSCSNVYVTGGSEPYYVPNGWYSVFDYATIKYNSEGQQIWVMRWSGPEEVSDCARALALDHSGNVFVTGYGDANSGLVGSDYVTIKYSQTLPNISLTIVPFTQPVQIPAPGGSFEYYLFASNGGPDNLTTDLWTKVILPNGSTLGPLTAPYTVTLDSGVTAWTRHQNVPGNAPAGTYYYLVCAGDYPNSIWAADTLTFTKLTTGDGPGVDNWEAQDLGLISSTPLTFALAGAYPNPFNPTTVASYELRVASQVRLTVWDTAGRLVSTLVDVWQEAGTHQATFDGSKLASGIYLARLEAGSFSAVQKLVLMK